MPGPILMYHKVAVPGPGAKVRAHYVTPGQFEGHLKLLKTLRFSSIRPEESREAPARSVAITFDDGYENFLTQALPRLEKYGYQSTAFAVTDRLGQTDTWDEGQEPLLTADQLRECAARGVEIGSHSCTHADLAAISPEQARDEIFRSQENLRNLGIEIVAGFCYPYGRKSDATIALVREAGYAYACSTEKGTNDAQTDVYRLRRINVRAETNVLMLAFKLLRNARNGK